MAEKISEVAGERWRTAGRIVDAVRRDLRNAPQDAGLSSGAGRVEHHQFRRSLRVAAEEFGSAGSHSMHVANTVRGRVAREICRRGPALLNRHHLVEATGKWKREQAHAGIEVKSQGGRSLHGG